MDSRQRTGRLTANLSSWRPASPVSLPPEMCGTVPSSVSPPASARGQWPFTSSIDTWASLPSRATAREQWPSSLSIDTWASLPSRATAREQWPSSLSIDTWASLPSRATARVAPTIHGPGKAIRGIVGATLAVALVAWLPRPFHTSSGLLAPIRLLPLHIYIYNMGFVSHMLFYFLRNLRIAQLLDFSQPRGDRQFAAHLLH